MSASSRPTRQPSCASATARFTETVLLPTPPLPLPTRMTLRTPGTRSAPPRPGARSTSAVKATSTRESCRGESTARTASSRRGLCGEAGVGSSRRTRAAFPSSMSTFFTIPSSPSVRPVEGSFTPCRAARMASELTKVSSRRKGRSRCLPRPAVSRRVQEGPAGPFRGALSLVEHYPAVDHYRLDAGRVPLGLLEGGGILDAVRVEDHQVGVRAGPQDAAVPDAHPPGGQGGDLADRLLQGEQLHVPHVVTQDPRHGAEGARMRPFAAEGTVRRPRAVVRVHRHPRLPQRGLDVLLLHGEPGDAHLSAVLQNQLHQSQLRREIHLPRHAREALAHELLQSGIDARDEQDAVRVEVPPRLAGDPVAQRRVAQPRHQVVHPARVHPVGQRGVQPVRGGDVRVGVGGHVDAVRPGPLDPRDHLLHVPPVRSTDLQVPDLHRDRGGPGDREGLVQRSEDPGSLAAQVGSVEAHVLRGHLRERDQLVRLREGARLVDETRRETERPLLHRFLDELLHPRELLRVGLRVAEAEHNASNLRRAHHHADVDRRPRPTQPAEVAAQIRPVHLQAVLAQPVFLLVHPGVVHGRGRDALAGQLAGDALPDLRLGARIDQHAQLALAEQIDEAGRHGQASRVDSPLRLRRRQLPDRGDAVPADAHVGAHPRGAGAVDHAATRDHQVVARRGGEEDEEERDHPAGATTTTPSSPTAPSTTAFTGSMRRASVASETSPSLTLLVVKWQVGAVPARAPSPAAQRMAGTSSRSAMRPSRAPPAARNRPSRSATRSPASSGGGVAWGPRSAGRSRRAPSAEAVNTEFSNSATAVSAQRPPREPCGCGRGTRSGSAITPWARSLRAAAWAARSGSSSRPCAVAATKLTWRRIPRCTSCRGVSAGAGSKEAITSPFSPSNPASGSSSETLRPNRAARGTQPSRRSWNVACPSQWLGPDRRSSLGLPSSASGQASAQMARDTAPSSRRSSTCTPGRAWPSVSSTGPVRPSAARVASTVAPSPIRAAATTSAASAPLRGPTSRSGAPVASASARAPSSSDGAVASPSSTGGRMTRHSNRLRGCGWPRPARGWPFADTRRRAGCASRRRVLRRPRTRPRRRGPCEQRWESK